MKHVSKLLCYMIRYNSNTSPNIIRTLTKSLLLSKLNYSIPFINMNIATSNQLQTTLLAMLYNILHPTVSTNNYAQQLLTTPNTYYTYQNYVEQAVAAVDTTLFAIKQYKPLLFIWAYACDGLQFNPIQPNINTHQYNMNLMIGNRI